MGEGEPPTSSLGTDLEVLRCWPLGVLGLDCVFERGRKVDETEGRLGVGEYTSCER